MILDPQLLQPAMMPVNLAVDEEYEPTRQEIEQAAQAIRHGWIDEDGVLCIPPTGREPMIQKVRVP